ncbi:unnamed protein product [Brugia timori]|uniref:I-set domain-containing protein n=1 Tax=Brugia timori TaxID=42155 RepID=A0A0R3QDB1_9BILA|nr:unnamed protein product [Brugia timori]
MIHRKKIVISAILNDICLQVTWLKNGKIVDLINSKGIMAVFKGSLALLKISSVVPKDSGEYTLVAENYYGKVKCFLFLKLKIYI